ncbi:MAG: NAD-dependent succinate-semialdehyde dehydrogenase [Marivibrio sp.]|uniref:NAD-dependent succinate-semialdehyde dehydrogenase n=1 Tax=Marivibrio sp. TaxID=2039719 RepID=UPI0032EB1679
MQLSNQKLFREQAYIGGEWVSADSGATFPVVNPSNGETIAKVARCGQVETRRAIDAAAEAWPAWRAKTAKERAQIMRKFFDLIMENQRDLAMIMTLEQGKPLQESMGEVAYGASFVEWFGEEGKRVYGDVIPQHKADSRIVVTKEPIGVTAGITPWNFPIAMITRKASPALAAGCPMVIKPAEATPLSALALCVLAEEAGIPKGVLSVVTGDRDQSAEIGGEMTSNPTVRKIGFTGSTAVGKLLMRQASDTVKKVSLELGGNAPFIVFDDADIESALPGAIACKFRNAGQTCVCANRILVQDGIYDKFVDRLKSEVAKMKVGDGLQDGVTIGPLIDERAIKKVTELVGGAKSAGAKASLGGDPHELGGNFFSPTVLEGVDQDMEIANNEIFGPVAPIIRFKDEADAIRIANDTPYGLAAYFYARDVGRVWRVAEGLEYGMVGINTGILSTEVAPFGGVKESGIGREGSKYGIEEWMEIKYLCMGDI